MKKCFTTRKELASEFGIDVKTFRKMLINKKIYLPKGLISQVKAIEIRTKFGISNNLNSV